MAPQLCQKCKQATPVASAITTKKVNAPKRLIPVLLNHVTSHQKTRKIEVRYDLEQLSGVFWAFTLRESVRRIVVESRATPKLLLAQTPEHGGQKFCEVCRCRLVRFLWSDDQTGSYRFRPSISTEKRAWLYLLSYIVGNS
jgi:hypothetical protein